MEYQHKGGREKYIKFLKLYLRIFTAAKTKKERNMMNLPKNIENEIKNIDNFGFFSYRIIE